jgi:hypothetical protein
MFNTRTVGSKVVRSFDDTLDPMVERHLLAKRRHIVICEYRSVKGIDAFPRSS